MLQFTKSGRGTLAETKRLLNPYSMTTNKDVSSNITLRLIHPELPILSSIPFVGIHSSVNI